MTLTVRPILTLNNDSAESVQKAALNHFNAAAFTSYTELTPSDPVTLLVIGRKDGRTGEAATSEGGERNKNNASSFPPSLFFPLLFAETNPNTVIPVTTNAPEQMPFLMQLYASPDYRSPLDPNSKVQTDKRIYAEARNQAAAAPTIYYLDLPPSPFLTPPPPCLHADFGAHPGKHRLKHQGDSLLRELQGLLPRGEGSPLQTRGLLFRLLSEQRAAQLLLRPAPGDDVHHLGPGVFRQTLLDGRECFFKKEKKQKLEAGRS